MAGIGNRGESGELAKGGDAARLRDRPDLGVELVEVPQGDLMAVLSAVKRDGAAAIAGSEDADLHWAGLLAICAGHQ